VKKFFALFMCLVLCFCFAGCKNTEERNEEAKAALTRVLNKEEPFTIHNADFNITTQQYLENFRFPTNNRLANQFAPCKYAFVDLDKDGVDELLVMDWLFNFLFLRYDEGKVYGYIPAINIRIPGFKTDGSFMTFQYNGYTDINRISFSGTSYEITQLAYKDDAANKYLLNGKPAKKSEVEAFFENRDKNTTEVAWTQIKQQ